MRSSPSYHDFVLQVEPGRDDPLIVRLLRSPFGPREGRFELPWSAAEIAVQVESLETVVLGGQEPPKASGSAAPVPLPRALGEQLFAALFPTTIREAFLQSLGLVSGAPGRGLRLRLVLDPTAEAVAPLCALPWETLFRPDTGDFLARSIQTPVVRYLPSAHLAEPPIVEPPLKILVVQANPRTTMPLQLRAERARIEQAFRDRDPSVVLDFLARPTLEELRDRLRDGRHHALHFMGHGHFDGASGDGILVFGARENEPVEVPARLLAEHLKQLGLRLAVLNACDTAALSRRQGHDPYGVVAAALVAAGLPAVVAMQFPISDQAAVAFSGSFYRALAAGDDLEAAVAEGRLAILRCDGSSLEWATPVLYLSLPEGRLVKRSGEEPAPPAELRSQILPFEDLIQDKTSCFVGREFVFEAIAAFTARNPRGYFHLTGDPGIGKTALAAQLVKRFGYIHHFNILGESHTNRAEFFLASVCSQLILRYHLPHGALPPEATRDSGFLKGLLAEVSGQLGDGEKAILVVDALDEVVWQAKESGANLLHLPVTLPEGVYVLLTSRRDHRLPLRFDCEHEIFPLDHGSPQNRADVEAYVAGFLPRPGIRTYRQQQGLTEADFVAHLVAKSEGNFMYLRHVLLEIEQGTYRDRNLDQIPTGLANYYEDHWKRIKARDPDTWFERQVPVLAALTSVDQPVSIELLCGVLGRADRTRVAAMLEDWQQFLHVVPPCPATGAPRLYRIYHGTFHDFIHDQDVVAEERIHLQRMRLRIGRYLRDRHLERRGRGQDPDPSPSQRRS